VLSPFEQAGTLPNGTILAAGMGDNAAAAFGLGATSGQAILSLGTSGVVSVIAGSPTKDASGLVAGFADGTGNYLPLACTLNGARVIDSTAELLGISHDQLAQLAISAPAGSGGLTILPYFEGERTPNLPEATGSIFGVTGTNFDRANIARSAIEGLLCGLADALEAITSQGVKVDKLALVGGAGKNQAVQVIAPQIFGMDISLPEQGEYVALGAARQAASALAGAEVRWELSKISNLTGTSDQKTRDAYRVAKENYLNFKS
jgi:xylulokinase